MYIFKLGQIQEKGFQAETSWGISIFEHNTMAKNKEKLHNSFFDKIDREYYFYQQYRTSLSTLFWVYTLERHPGEAKSQDWWDLPCLLIFLNF